MKFKLSYLVTGPTAFTDETEQVLRSFLLTTYATVKWIYKLYNLIFC